MSLSTAAILFLVLINLVVVAIFAYKIGFANGRQTRINETFEG